MSKYWKHPTYGMVFGPETVTPIGRNTWPSLVTPKDPPPPKPGEAPGKPRFEDTLLLKKGHGPVDAFIKEATETAKEMEALFNEGKATSIHISRILRDGDEADHEKYPYYAGHWVLIARNTEQPQCFDSNGEEIPHNSFLGGMQTRFAIQYIVTSHGLSFKLKAVQLVKDDGVRFGGGVQKDYGKLLGAITDDAETEEEPAQVEAVVEKKARGRPQNVKPGQITPPPGYVKQQTIAPIVQKADPNAMREKIAQQVKTPKKGMALALDKI